jgi:hypothetical protein
VAVVVANEWKDANDKVMPVKQWLEERRFMQVCYTKSSLVVYAKLLLYVKFAQNSFTFWNSFHSSH